MSIGLILIIIVSVIAGGYFILLIIIQLISKRPNNLGISGGRLQACPDIPNCVCSYSKEKNSKIEPYSFSKSIKEQNSILIEIIQKYPRTRIIKNEINYVYAEFRSLAWRFIDDVEFFLDETAKCIHFRSASRIGTNDFGMNRKRMEDIRQLLKES
ncbi:hypothetical protein NEF87_000692 [Candidatus Lokiarchaeum ossiferum]|uniref:DUF1499 domain-containing protein n=1 Tax=Candidatus Lokiarchaeum ossiferum TaxID=2951803 RepID=A0ABY6HPV1_9ARCH|nr:hypothetical protein NEF87_000692 [Candidatus Lokiarchaeum sp. B-35]